MNNEHVENDNHNQPFRDLYVDDHLGRLGK